MCVSLPLFLSDNADTHIEWEKNECNAFVQESPSSNVSDDLQKHNITTRVRYRVFIRSDAAQMFDQKSPKKRKKIKKGKALQREWRADYSELVTGWETWLRQQATL